MKKILVIDNYDSFTYNLVHYLEAAGGNVTVWRNDAFTIEEAEPFDKILLSPGPGIPSEAGILEEVIKTYATRKSILGVCLGMQAIGEVFGGSLINMETVHHGVPETITIHTPDETLYYGLDNKIEVGRYHSWTVSQEYFPAELEVTATDKKGQIMSLRHRLYDIKGVQFHPESVLTPQGRQIIANWLNY